MEVNSPGPVSWEFIQEIPMQEGTAQKAMVHLNNQFLSLVYYNTCRNLQNAEIREWKDSDLKEILGEEFLEKVMDAAVQFRDSPSNFTTPLENIPLQTERVGLKGQEKLHCEGKKCTKYGYTGDDTEFCILEDWANTCMATKARKLGYEEISTDRSIPQLLYTLNLGPCIGILAVGMGNEGKFKKAALMHEDYSTIENSVTNMFNNSFKEGIEGFHKINFYLFGGNGGREFTTNRFNIHKSEINELKNKYGCINLVLSADSLGVADDQFQFDQTDIFVSTMESSAYLWTLHRDQFQNKSLEVMRLSGQELTHDELDAYYREYIYKIVYIKI